MASYGSLELRRQVAERAGHTCEYCLINEDDTFYGCQVDHIISEKHGGTTEFEKLAYACAVCNQSKGSDLGSISVTSGNLVRFFHPRRDDWRQHFRLHNFKIVPSTEVGDVTARILGFNKPERIMERELLMRFGRYPPPSLPS